jgi:hypothetical protein
MISMGSTRFEGARLEAGLLRRVLAHMHLRPAVQRRLGEVAESIERGRLFHPVAICRTLPVSVEAPSQLHFDGGHLIEGNIGRLTGAMEAAIIFITLGAAWSDAVAACFRNDQPLHGFLLDEIGTTLLEQLSRRAQATVRLSARQRGLEAGSPVQLGQPGWPLSAQPLLAELAEARSAGIEVTATGMLAPVKSVSMMIGIGHSLRRWTQHEACCECPAFERCEHRRSAEKCQ